LKGDGDGAGESGGWQCRLRGDIRRDHLPVGLWAGEEGLVLPLWRRAALLAQRDQGAFLPAASRGGSQLRLQRFRLPGEEFYLLQAVERGFIADYDPRRDIAAHFVTVIITPRGNPKNIRKVEDFARPGVRVGLGNPKACAIGIWHEKTFKRAGIWEAVRKNAVMQAKCIPELGNATQHKLIDGTIVWATTAVLYLRDVEIIPLEPKYRGVVRLPVAILKFAKHRREAQMLKDLILSDEGKEIFLSHAYAVGRIPTDADGFVADGGKSTDQLMRWLVNAKTRRAGT